jgi:hypothetical protein
MYTSRQQKDIFPVIQIVQASIRDHPAYGLILRSFPGDEAVGSRN